jgi:Domain of unknown function (DUF4920)
MKTLGLSLLLTLCVSLAMSQKYDSFGTKLTKKNSQHVSILQGKTNFDQPIKVEGEVESVCQAAGCWMKIKLNDGSLMRVTFKDYGFFVPKNIAGQKVIFEGTPSMKTTSVAELKHYAEDAGKSKAEIDQINTPKTELTFLANGVLVPKK